MLPVVAVSSAVSQVILGRVASQLRTGRTDLYRSYMNWSVPVAGVSLAVGGAVFVAAPLASSLLSSEWVGVVPIMQALALLTAVRMFASSLAPTLGLLERHGLQIVADASRVSAILIVMVVVASEDLSLATTALLLSVVVSATYLVSWLFAAYAFKVEPTRSRLTPRTGH